jgi:hypothetical protein
MELAHRGLGLEVVERPVDRTGIPVGEELFMTGTAARIVAITKVDQRPIGNDVTGPITGSTMHYMHYMTMCYARRIQIICTGTRKYDNEKVPDKNDRGLFIGAHFISDSF